ncbi:MAG: hypothetical protein CM1200mP2_12430 [Planctomycetaceae bacterium]|nr:MAG: hypothetical protein CM1200mP2_12430 [Planctomycetaceae bacterium]
MLHATGCAEGNGDPQGKPMCSRGATTPRSPGQERHLDLSLGGYSQMETWDPKPALNKYADKT